MKFYLYNNKPVPGLVLFIFLLFTGYQTTAQQYRIDIPDKEIPVNGILEIKLIAKNTKITDYKGFPEIKGFRSSGTRTSTQVRIINGNKSLTNIITKQYIPTRQGTYTIPAFTIKINGNTVSHQGTQVKVGPKQSKSRKHPFSKFFDRNEKEKQKKQEREFIDVKADAFLGLTVDKNEVYTGEGVTASLALFISRENKARMGWPKDINKQFSEIIKKLKPKNCWEEKFNTKKQREKVRIKEKDYIKYTLYKSRFFPINTETIRFPPIKLKMIKYKRAKNPSFFGKNHKKGYKTFHSRPKTVKVKALPPHPLKNKVSVGKFELQENLLNMDEGNIKTGKSIDYKFTIRGEGNIQSITAPKIPDDKNFDIYDPNVVQNIDRRDNYVTGSKTFKYYLIPQEPGEYDLGNYFKWVYFDPYKEVYDTLKSDILLHITGKSQKNMTIKSNDLGGFYNQIHDKNHAVSMLRKDKRVQFYCNIALLIMILLTFSIMIRKYFTT